MLSKFDSITDVVNFLREPMLSATVTDSRIIGNGLKPSKKQRTEKNLSNVMSTTPQSEGNIQILPKGRVRYGPITVNPRKEPSKTLFTGRRSKYEVLSADEDEKRRDRRERNKVAATKCREKRETVLSHLDNQLNGEMNNHKQLLKLIDNLIQQKNYLDSVIENHFNECPLLNNSAPSMIFGDSSFLSSIIDAPPPPLPSYQQEIIDTDEEELSHILDPAPVLTNSAYTTDDSSSALIPPQQPMTNSSIERIINTLQTPTVSMESNHSMLFNSAFGSSCAKQHSSSSEDDSLPPKHTNPYVC